MEKNVGSIDKILRIIIGLVLVGYALAPTLGLMPATGYNVYGWVGVIPLGTALLGICPLYSIIGLKTCATRAKEDASTDA